MVVVEHQHPAGKRQAVRGMVSRPTWKSQAQIGYFALDSPMLREVGTYEG